MSSATSQTGSRHPPATGTTKTMLKPSEQRLIEMARRIRYGCLTNLRVRNGELVLKKAPRARRRHRLGKPERGRCIHAVGEDFRLKQQHRDLIAQLRTIRDGVIVSIEIQDGLPVNLITEEDVA